jgi:hypothetical protein
MVRGDHAQTFKDSDFSIDRTFALLTKGDGKYNMAYYMVVKNPFDFSARWSVFKF